VHENQCQPVENTILHAFNGFPFEFKGCICNGDNNKNKHQPSQAGMYMYENGINIHDF
jgi:hypothetical protein